MMKIIAKKTVAAVLTAGLLFCNGTAFADVPDVKVVSGDAVIDKTAHTLTVTSTSADTILSSVSASWTTEDTVNLFGKSFFWRVTGDSASNIGNLYSTGSVIFVNPNGITFRAGATINVQNLIASTLDIQNSNYLNHQYIFEKQAGSNPGKIINEANIISNGGSIILLAEQIDNKGVLKADLGTVVLGVGEKQTLTFDDNGFVNLVVDRGLTNAPADGKAAITNEGTIQANSGTVYLTAKMFNDTMDTLINNTGIIQATHAVEKDGKIVFESNGVIKNPGTLNTNLLQEHGYSFHSSGTIEGGKSYFDNLDGAASYSGVISSDVTDAGNIIIDGDITLAGFGSGITFTAGGAFIMDPGTHIDGYANLYDHDLTLIAGQDSTLGNIVNVPQLSLNASGTATPTYFANGDITTTTGADIQGGVTLNMGTHALSTGTLNITNSSTLVAPSSTLTVSSIFFNAGTFINNNGTVVLDGTNQFVFGSTTFYNLTKTVTSADTLTFQAGATQTINGTLTLQGSAGNLLSLRSIADGTQWNINPQGPANSSYLDIKDSNNIGSGLIYSPNSINSGHNSNWAYVPRPVVPVVPVPPADQILPVPSSMPANVNSAVSQARADLSEALAALNDSLNFRNQKLNESMDAGKEDENDDGMTSTVTVDEGAVSVTALDGSETMVYDGEKASVSKQGAHLSMRELYVSSLNGISVLRGKTHEKMKEFGWKERPAAMAASRDGRSVVVSSSKLKSLVRIDTESFGTQNIQGLNEGASSIAMDKKGNTAYAADAKNDVVQVFNVPSKKLSREFRTGSMPTQAILSPDATKLYVVERLDARLSEYDALSGKRMASIKTGTSPFGAVMSSDGLNLYVTDTESNQIFKIDAKLMKVISQIKVTDSPYTVQINPKDPDKLYVANRLGKSVSIIDLKQGREIGKIAVGERPSDIAVLPEGDKLYVTNELSNNLSVINLKQQKTIQEIPTGTAPNHVVLSTPEAITK